MRSNKATKSLKNWLIHPIKRRIAKYYLAILKKCFDLKVIGITGSCGKTTTKEMLASILQQKGKTIYSYANIDPVYNIPTTILKCRPSTKYLVLEMGVEYPGEMDFYLWLAKPDIGVITNIYPTHTQYFKDQEGVFEEKSKLVKDLSSNDLAVLNKRSSYLKRLQGKIRARIIWFEGSGDFFSQNLQAARALAEHLGCSKAQIKRGEESFTPQAHRWQLIKHKSGALLIDDSYNNNPAAAREALKSFLELAEGKEKVVVFGDMLELGKLEKKYHREINVVLDKLSLKKIICVGQAVREIKGRNVIRYSSWEKAVLPVKQLLSKDTAILIKGSRSVGLDRLVDALL